MRLVRRRRSDTSKLEVYLDDKLIIEDVKLMRMGVYPHLLLQVLRRALYCGQKFHLIAYAHLLIPHTDKE